MWCEKRFVLRPTQSLAGGFGATSPTLLNPLPSSPPSPLLAQAAGQSPRGAGGGGHAPTCALGREAQGSPLSAAVLMVEDVPAAARLVGWCSTGNEVATMLLLGGGVVRRLVVAPSRPRSGPFDPHLGLSMAALPPAVGGVARAGGGLDGDMFTVARR
jgi:hypothetical protein